MNLEKLFQTQKVLRDRIGYNEPDRFNKLILALLVELGECANEWRGFKFWSKDRLPRTQKARAPYMDLDDAEFYNPLLEEYVDGLHFVLELGLEIKFMELYEFKFPEKVYSSVEKWLLSTFGSINDFRWDSGHTEYVNLFNDYLGLGCALGFTWQEIERAYFAKNKINHVRQETGY
jgi:dimeric dUTPase (all-alpha-NTP-PPase superfamily)